MFAYLIFTNLWRLFSLSLVHSPHIFSLSYCHLFPFSFFFLLFFLIVIVFVFVLVIFYPFLSFPFPYLSIFSFYQFISYPSILPSFTFFYPSNLLLLLLFPLFSSVLSFLPFHSYSFNHLSLVIPPIYLSLISGVPVILGLPARPFNLSRKSGVIKKCWFHINIFFSPLPLAIVEKKKYIRN